MRTLGLICLVVASVFMALSFILHNNLYLVSNIFSVGAIALIVWMKYE